MELNNIFSPILVDFGKACFLNNAKKKILSDEEEDKYHKEHFHIAQEVSEGTCAQSILSDVYAPVNVNPRTPPRPGHSGAFDKHSLLKLQNAPHPKVRFFL